MSSGQKAKDVIIWIGLNLSMLHEADRLIVQKLKNKKRVM